MDPANDMVTSGVCAAAPAVCHFWSVTGGIMYRTLLKSAPMCCFFGRVTPRLNVTLTTVQMSEQHLLTIGSIQEVCGEEAKVESA